MGAVENSLPVVDSLTSEERSESEQSEIRAGSDRYGIESGRMPRRRAVMC